MVDLLVDRFNYQYVSIYLAQPDQTLHLGAQRGYASTVDVFDGSLGVVGRVMRERQATLVSDVKADPDYVAADPRIVSEICAPMVVGDAFLGVLNVESIGRVLDTTDLRLVSAWPTNLAPTSRSGATASDWPISPSGIR